MKRGTVIVLFLVLAAAVLLMGLYSYSALFPPKSDKEFDTVKVTRRDLGATVQATGIVKAVVGAEVKVGSRVPGKVVELPVNVGQKVTKGQVIARIEQEDLEAKVKLREAALAEAEAEKERLRKDLDRDSNLAGKDSISAQRFDTTLAQYHVAKARVDKAEAELVIAKTELSYATLTAPIDGTVASVNTIQGETVTTGLNAPTFMKIIDLSRLEVWAYVDENDIGNVRTGQEAIFTVASYPGEEFKGKVTSIYPSATIQDNVVYYITTVDVDNRDEKLRPDMTTDVLIYLDQRKGVLCVPNKALRREGGRRLVYCLDNAAIHTREVKTGWRNTSHTEILEGLTERDLVVIGEVPENMIRRGDD
ncbi:MAG: efflux RND transporter periplasmic adaptor subunit [Desulfomonilaceae bacterium]|nr:efflux RND transporter periplasmic adaptor subunit [Desulfomonilaceae bacterium]